MTRLRKSVQHCISLIGLFAVIALTVEPTSACRVFYSAENRVSTAYVQGEVNAVVLVQIKRANYTSEQRYDAHPWQATASIENILWGTYSGGPVTIDGGNGSASCDLGFSIPSAGDEWIVYISKISNLAWIALPKQVALQVDPSIRTQMHDPGYYVGLLLIVLMTGCVVTGLFRAWLRPSHKEA